MTRSQRGDGFPLQVFTKGRIDENDIEKLPIAIKKLFGRGLHDPGTCISNQSQALR